MTLLILATLLTAWGGYHRETWLDSEQRIIGYHARWNAALSTKLSVDSTASYSPWEGEGAPPADYEVARGTQWFWDEDDKIVACYNWTQTLDGRTRKVRLRATEGTVIEPPQPKYAWGLYEHANEAGAVYRLFSWFCIEAQNPTQDTYEVTVEADWQHGDVPQEHTTIESVTVGPGELQGVIPEPQGLPWARCVEDRVREQRP